MGGSSSIFLQGKERAGNSETCLKLGSDIILTEKVQPCGGIWSDNCSLKMGRRHLFILAGSLIVSVAISQSLQFIFILF
ncbi:hypothetical protein RchiOBHm_Chr5g0039551 [Rosa chinensis]|uniref:Uncharacterized protein n=1 Tax=Rosa chinensis TaxID=74649 RepID=A0A2P6QCB7_ROSCH|nr:hypothetical protein RchiOBHm_Chr5g0039551 [Rosa chinensis]